MVRVGERGRDARRRGPGLTIPDDALRPALEAAVEVGRAAASATPPVALPGPLRPLLRLRRLPDRALPAVRKVLDEDELFRSVVAAATTEELVGRVSWLYLQRPDAWEAEVAATIRAQDAMEAEAGAAREEATAARRLASVEEALRRAEDELAVARAEAADAKARLGEERRARRSADTASGRLRRRVAELEAAEEAGAELAAVRAERDALAAEVGGLRASLAEAEASSAAPQPRPDEAPLRRALDDLDRARRELATFLAGEGPSRPRAKRRRADRRQPASLPPAVFDDTVEAADHLVRLAGVLVLVDGYNVTKLARAELALPDQRRWLLDAARSLAARTDAEIHVVFDGAEDQLTAPAHGPRRVGVHVRYTGVGVEADDELLALVAAAPPRRVVVVVSDDRRVRDGAAALGANLVGSGTFADLLRR